MFNLNQLTCVMDCLPKWLPLVSSSSPSWATTAVHPCNDVVFQNGKEELLMPSTIWMNVQCILLSERSLDSKDNERIHDSMYMTFWKRQTRGIKKPSVAVRA